MTQTITLRPTDAWFFGGAQPNTRESSDQTNVRSLFPPTPFTVVGAVRAAAARQLGWDGASGWTDAMTEQLGDGLELKPLDYRGPMLLKRRQRDGESDQPRWERLYPAPLHLLGKSAKSDGAWSPETLLAPASEQNAVETDTGQMRCPVKHDANAEGVDEPDGIWLTTDGLEDVLAFELPETDNESTHCVDSRALWRHEPRVGLTRDLETRRVKEGELYSPSYVRLQRGVALGTTVSRLPDAGLPDRLMLGGESRMANVDTLSNLPTPEAPLEQIEQTGRMTVTLVTPMRVDGDAVASQLQPGQRLGDAFDDLEGAKLVSACIGKPELIGGWHPTKNRPLPLRPHLPAGTTLFLQLPDARLGTPTADLHGSKIGERTRFGFGEIVIGTWNEG